jgi:hypothetical protein
MDGYGDEQARRQDVQAERDGYTAGGDININTYYTPQSKGLPFPRLEGDVAAVNEITAAELREMGPEMAAAMLAQTISLPAARSALSGISPRGAGGILTKMDPGQSANLLVAMGNRDRALDILDAVEVACRKEIIVHFESTGATGVLRARAEKRLREAEARTLKAEERAQVKVEVKGELRRSQERLMPRTWANRVCAALYVLALTILDIGVNFLNWESPTWLFLLIPTSLLAALWAALAIFPCRLLPEARLGVYLPLAGSLDVILLITHVIPVVAGASLVAVITVVGLILKTMALLWGSVTWQMALRDSWAQQGRVGRYLRRHKVLLLVRAGYRD